MILPSATSLSACKPAEAVIAAFNPTMVGELRSLDDAEVFLRFDEKTGELIWGVRLPNDDGTFAALAPALALSGGAAEEKLGDREVDRLGPPGAPLMARGDRVAFLGGNRTGLDLAIGRPISPREEAEREGLHLSIDPGTFDRSKSLMGRRLAEFFRVRPSRELASSATATLDGSTFSAVSLLLLPSVEDKTMSIEPGWLDWIPLEGAMVGFALATDTTAKSWDRTFDIADRVERADPARAGVAPLRLRLDLLARSVGLRTEDQLYPHLKGISGWVGADAKAVSSAFLALHFDEVAAADLVASAVRLPGSPQQGNPGEGRARSLGEIEGRPLSIARAGKSVLIAWGAGVLETSIIASKDPSRSAGPSFPRPRPDLPPVAYLGSLWPARVPGLLPEGTPLKTAIEAGQPVLFEGSWDALGLVASCSISRLDVPVRRFLELIPLDPPPDR